MGNASLDPAGLKWTGHPLADVGVAGVCAFTGRNRPEEVTLADLDAVSDFMIENYYSGKLSSFLTCVFMNASFVQPKPGPENKERFNQQYLRAHRAAPHPAVKGQRCVFSGLPATSPLVRTHLPLFSGEDVLNWRPNGESWVPVAGPFVTSLLFLPMAGRRAEGKLLIVHSDDTDLLLGFARKYLEDNRRLLTLALPTERGTVPPGYDRELPQWDEQKKGYKYADVKGPRSLVVTDLIEIASRAAPSDLRPAPSALTIYLLSNSGQGPSLEIFDVPGALTSFLRKAAGPATQSAWKAIAERFRPLGGDKGRKGARPAARSEPLIAGRPGWSENPAFEKLCDIFGGGFVDRGLAADWLRTFVLGRIQTASGKTRYERTRCRTWALASLFLEEVLSMTKGRIEAIRSFADKLAAHIQAKKDKKLFKALTYRKLHEVRSSLRRAQLETPGLFGLDEYATVWLHEDGNEFLVRDLVCIRLVEKLHELGYFRENPEDELDRLDEPVNDKEGEE